MELNLLKAVYHREDIDLDELFIINHHAIIVYIEHRENENFARFEYYAKDLTNFNSQFEYIGCSKILRAPDPTIIQWINDDPFE